MSTKVFASAYERDSKERVLFPSDKRLRALLFPFSDSTEHVAKAQMLMVKELVEFLTEPSDTILDPFAGSGTILVATTTGRKVIMIELEEHFCTMIEQNIVGIKRTVPNIDSLATLIPGDCSKVLPLPPGIVNHIITSPPYASILKKRVVDKLSLESGYGSIVQYSQHQDNVGNLSDFIYHQKMEQIYRKCFNSLPSKGTMTIIIKDRMEQGKRISLSDRAERDCIRLGFKLLQRDKWYAPGGAYTRVHQAQGLETVDEEYLITLVKE